jgi:hypothetical protein
MSELDKLGKQFDKVASEAKALDQRMGGLYEDMGHILSRYYKIGEISEEQMKERLGMNESVNEAKKTDQWTLDVIDHLEYLKYPKKDIDYIMDFEKKKIKGWKRKKVNPTSVGQQLNIILKKLRRNEAIESKSDCGCGCGGVTEGGCSTNLPIELSEELTFEINTFLERPVLSKNNNKITVENSELSNLIPTLVKNEIHKRLSSGVKKEFIELLKNYK